MVREAIDSGFVRPQLGHLVLLLWRDAQHASEWQERQAESSADLRVVTLDSQSVPEITLPEGRDRSAVAFVGAGLGSAENLSDTILKYYITLGHKN